MVPVVVTRRSSGKPRVWWRLSSPPYECYVNPDDATEILLDATGRHLAVAGNELEESRRGFTLQEAMKCLLRGFLAGHGWAVVHAAAVQADSGAVLLLGHKGAGKSTLKLALLDAGCAFLSADRTFIRTTRGGGAYALPWPGAVRLAPTTVDLFQSLLDRLPDGAMTTNPHTGKSRISYAVFFRAFGPVAPVVLPVRALVVVDRAFGAGRWALDRVDRSRCFGHILSEENETRPDWLASARWWPWAVSPDPFGRTPVYRLVGDGGPDLATGLVLDELSKLSASNKEVRRVDYGQE